MNQSCAWVLLVLFASINSFAIARIQLNTRHLLELIEHDKNLSRSPRLAGITFRIGAILDSKEHSIEKAIVTGIEIANTILKARDKLSAPLLKPEIVWIQKGEFFQTADFACNLLKMGVVALVSPLDPLLRKSVKMISKQFGIPLIETHWNTDRSNSRYTVNIRPDHDAFGNAVYEYVSRYEKWSHMVVILAHYDVSFVLAHAGGNLMRPLIELYDAKHASIKSRENNLPDCYVVSQRFKLNYCSTDTLRHENQGIEYLTFTLSDILGLASTIPIIYDLSKFSNLLNNFEGTLVIRIWGDDPLKLKEIVSQLATNKEKNFLLDIPYWRAKEFLVLAYVHNMTGEQYHYIFTDWDIHLLDLKPFKIDDGAKITTFSIVPNIEVDGRYRRGSTIEHLRQIIHNIERAQRSSEIYPFLPAPIALTLDAMLMFSAGLASQTQHISAKSIPINCEAYDSMWPYGELLVNASKVPRNRDLPLLTGYVVFDRAGLRSDFNMTILSLQENGFIPIGFWNKHDKLRISNLVNRQKRVIKKPLTTLTLRVTTLPDAPFVIPLRFDAYGQPLKTPDAWEGYCVDLLNEISKDIGFNYTIHIVKDNNYGSLVGVKNGVNIYNGMVNEVITGEADMAVAAMTITYDREQVLDFSTPWMTLGGSLLFTRPKAQKPSIFSFLQPLSPTVWAYVITTYIVVSLGLFLVARLSPYEWQNPHPCESFSDEKENQFTILSSFWFFVSPLLNQGTEMAPHTISTRLLTGIWWFFALIIISTYTANLAAFLTVDTTKSPIESVEDLVAQTKIKYGTLASGSSHDFFKNSKIPVFQKMWKFMSKHNLFVRKTEEGIARVLQGDYVFVLESTWNEFYNQRNCRLMQVGRLLDSKGYGIGLPQGSPYRDAISESILKLQKQQILDSLKRKWWTEYNISEPCTNMKEGSKEASSLDIEQVGGVFVLLVIGFFWAFIVSIVEFCVHNKACMKTHGTLFSEMWKELKFAMRCMTPSTRIKSSTSPTPPNLTPKIDGEVAAGLAAAAISLAPPNSSSNHLVVPHIDNVNFMNTKHENSGSFSSCSSHANQASTDKDEAYPLQNMGRNF